MTATNQQEESINIPMDFEETTAASANTNTTTQPTQQQQQEILDLGNARVNLGPQRVGQADCVERAGSAHTRKRTDREAEAAADPKAKRYRTLTSTTVRSSVLSNDKDITSKDDFVLVIRNHNLFLQQVEIASNTVPQITFEVVKDDEFEGLRAECMSSNGVCAVILQFPCEVQRGPNADTSSNPFFCVNVKTFKIILNTIPEGCSLKLRRQINGSEISMQIIDHTNSGTKFASAIKTIESELSANNYRNTPNNYFFVIRTQKLKEMLNTATKLEANNILLQTIVPASMSNYPTCARLKLKIDADGANVEQVFPCYKDKVVEDPLGSTGAGSSKITRFKIVSPQDGGMADVDEQDRAALDGECVEIHSGAFSVSYLNQFIGKLSRDQIELRIFIDRSYDNYTAYPIVIHYAQSNEQSFAQFLIAPTVVTDDFGDFKKSDDAAAMDDNDDDGDDIDE